jgi:hypothetical protein
MVGRVVGVFQSSELVAGGRPNRIRFGGVRRAREIGSGGIESVSSRSF